MGVPGSKKEREGNPREQQRLEQRHSRDLGPPSHWQQLANDCPYSRDKNPCQAVCSKLKSYLIKNSAFIYLNAASFPMLFPLFQLKQIAFRIAMTEFHLVSMASLRAELGFAFDSGQDGGECDAG